MERQYRLSALGRRALGAEQFARDDLCANIARRLGASAASGRSLLEESVSANASIVTVALAQLAMLGAIEELLVDETGIIRAVVTGPNVVASTLPRGNHSWIAQAHIFFRHQHNALQCACPMTPAVIASDDPALLQAVRCAGQTPRIVDGHDPWLALLADHGFLRSADSSVNPVATWPFHDALLHQASTSGNATSGGYGATFPLGSTDPPLPSTFDSSISAVEIDLAIEQPSGMCDAMAARRSVRTFQSAPVPRTALAALLNAALANRETAQLANGDHLVFRPYMSGGARGELSFLLIARNCADVPVGVYWYDPDRRRLLLVDGLAPLVPGTISLLSQPAGATEPPPAAALLVVADYARMAWKYEAIAYSTILRNVGAAYQALGMAAAAAGIGVCALGGGWAAIANTGIQLALGDRVIVGALIMGLPANAERNDE